MHVIIQWPPFRSTWHLSWYPSRLPLSHYRSHRARRLEQGQEEARLGSPIALEFSGMLPRLGHFSRYVVRPPDAGYRLGPGLGTPARPSLRGPGRTGGPNSLPSGGSGAASLFDQTGAGQPLADKDHLGSRTCWTKRKKTMRNADKVLRYQVYGEFGYRARCLENSE